MKEQASKYFGKLALLLLLLIFLPVAGETPGPLQQIAEEYWQHHLAEQAYYRLKFGLPIEKLPDPSYQKAKTEAAFARSILEKLARIRVSGLSHQDWISYEMLKWDNTNTVEAEQFFILDVPVTPYASPLPLVHRIFTEFLFREKKDLGHYLKLLRQYPAFLHAVEVRVRGQYERGIVLPKEELEQVLAFLSSFEKKSEQSVFYVKDERLKTLPAQDSSEFQRAIGQLIDSEIYSGFKAITDFLSGPYRKKAPDTVGLSQYPKGNDYYRYLVKLHVTLQTTPEEVHQIGWKEVDRINADMKKVRDSLGFQGSKAEFHRFLKTDTRFFPKSPEQIGETLESFIKRIEPKIESYFHRKPRAPYGVRRLDPALEGAMTFGYYRDPTASDPKGIYFYNGSNLNQRSLLPGGSLIYHELVPGHHFQICLQSENTTLPHFRREGGTTAFVEGWAEYASGLAGEMGMYQEPYEKYGRLVAEMFLTCRLVVDTGMNYLGWPRAKAADFLRENTLLSETEILTETLRYSTDIPGQALGYKMGSKKILELREKARGELKDRFDIRKFHDAVIGSGSMPLSVLEKHIAWFVEGQK